jgi:hypothetical protein
VLQKPYGEALLKTVADFTNRPPSELSELVRRWSEAGMPLDRPAGEQDLAAALEYLVRWAQVVDAATELERIALLNTMLAEYTAHPRLTMHPGSDGWHLHYRDDGLGLGKILGAAVTVATAEHLAQRGLNRVGRCASPDCGNAYVDFTRGGRQRYCAHPCANRDAVRRHRARHAPAGSEGSAGSQGSAGQGGGSAR